MSDPIAELGRVNAMYRLGTNIGLHPVLAHKTAEARLDLAAAIIAMDESEGVPGRHNLNEQQAVNEALVAYGDSLASLIRGEE